MNVNRVIALLKDLEGWRDYVYDDRSPWPRTEVARLDCREVGGQYKVAATGGTATIGYGETSADFIDNYWGRRITQAEALAKMADRVQGFYQGVLGCIDAELTAHQWEAVTCRAYQAGAGGFCRSETAALLNGGHTASALAKWREEFAHPDRSEVEIAHFLTPDEEDSSMRFVSRSEWGARSPTGRSSAPGMTRGVGVHWLGPGSSRADHAGCVAQMREVQAFHMGPQRSWADFAYNAAACRHGYVFEGRGPKVRNAANGGGSRNGTDANAGWASVLYLEGTGGPGLTPEGQDAINDAAEYLGVAGGEWLGHRDFLGTECPGDRIYAWVHGGHPRSSGSTPNPVPVPQPEEPEVAKVAYPLQVDAGERRKLPILAIGGGFGWTKASVTFASTGVEVRRAVVGPNERPIEHLSPDAGASSRRFEGRWYVDLRAGDEWVEVELGTGEGAGVLDLYVEAADG